MKVKITHTMELDEVPARVKELIDPTKKMITDAVAHLTALDFLLSNNSKDNISIGVLHMDAARKSLAEADNIIREASGMLAGVEEYYVQQSTKEAYEQQLEEQERQAEADAKEEIDDDKPF